jgi:proline iminopeptidase
VAPVTADGDEPYDHGMLDVGDGNLVYWETCGNPDGKPAVVLHGGPGSGAGPSWRKLFDPDAYRIVLFDQRGCGRSTPHASDPATDLSVNTTHHLIADIELLRRHLGVERWLVLGASWGSVLGLAYAEKHPENVSEVVLFSVVANTRREVDWVTRDMRRIFPEAWEDFRAGAGLPPGHDGKGIVDAYARLLADPDPAVREQAAKDWCAWEDVHPDIRPGRTPSPRYQDPVFRMAFARLVTHYWRHAAWLDEGVLLREAHRLSGIPGVLISGRLDVSGPVDVAFDLSRAWGPACELVVIEEAVHGSGGATSDAVRAAVARFAGSPS